jgi:O-antigen/teichoic acid export membrane protein
MNKKPNFFQKIKNKAFRNSLLKGSSIAFVIRLAGTGLGFVFNIIMARMLGASESGLFFLVLSVLTTATVFGDMGLSKSLIRFVAAHAGKNDWSSVQGVYHKSLGFMLVASGLTSGLTYLGAGWLANTLFSKPELVTPIQWIALAIIPTNLLFLTSSFLQGLHKIILFSTLQIPGFFFSIFAIVGIYVFHSYKGVFGVVLAYISASILMALISGWISFRETSEFHRPQGNFSTKTLLDSCIPLLWSKLGTLVLSKVSTTLIIGVFLASKDVGIYNLAFRTAALTTLLVGTVNSVAAPKFAELYSRNELLKLSKVAKNTAKITLLSSLPVLIPLFLFPSFILRMFGPEFTQGNWVLTILIFGQLVNSATGSVDMLLTMCGHEKFVRNNNLLSAAVNVAANFILIPLFGINGAAFADCLGIIFQNIASTLWSYKKLGFAPLPFIGSKSMPT